MTDIKFIPSEDMIKELQKRFDEMVFLGAAKRTVELEDLVVSFSGSYHACVGLIEVGKLALHAGGVGDDDNTTD